MGDSHEQRLETDFDNDTVVNPMERENISEMDLCLDEEEMLDECLKRIEIENDNGTCSKESVLPLDNEIPMTGDCDKLTQDLIYQLHDLVVNTRIKVSSTTFNSLAEKHQNVIMEQVNENERNKHMLEENKNCDNSIRKEHNSNNLFRVEQQNESALDNGNSQKKALKRPNSNTSGNRIGNKKAKTKSSFKCRKSLRQRKRNNFVKKRKEFKKRRQNKKDRKQKTRNTEKKIKKITGKLQLKDQKNNKHCNGHVKKASKRKSVTSIKKTSLSNKRHKFHHRSSKLRTESTRNNPTVKKKRSFCVMM